MALIYKKEIVQPIKVTSQCDCTPDGSLLVYSGSSAGRPVQHIYSCSVCHKMYYIGHESVQIEYKPIGGCGND